MAFVVADAELLLDHLSDAGTGPHLTPEAVGLRAVPEELGNHALLPSLAGAMKCLECAEQTGDLLATYTGRLYLLWAQSATGDYQASGETLHLHATDSGDEWLLTLEPGRIEVAREHAKADLALRGAVSDLELVLYQRPPVAGVERFGDERVLDAWYREFKFD